MDSAFVKRLAASCGAVAIALGHSGCGDEGTNAENVRVLEKPVAQRREEWRKSMSRTGPPKKGCFESEYPSTEWKEVHCEPAPRIPLVPPRRPQPGIVGSVCGDFAAGVSSLISSAEGSFPNPTGVMSETCDGGIENGVANAYTLQLNTNNFTTSLCSGAANPSVCQGWQQFLYSSASYGGVLIQYWLLNYGNYGSASCPSGWTSYDNVGELDCYQNTNMVTKVPIQPITNLGNLILTGTAGSNTDTVTLSTGSGSGHLYTQNPMESVLDLARGWLAAEFNIYGDADGSEAVLNTGSTINVQISVDDGTTVAPTCLAKAFTGESNNLTLTTPSHPIGGASPGIMFTERFAAGATPGFCLPGDLVPIISPLLLK
jgi:hypothetical protein